MYNVNNSKRFRIRDNWNGTVTEWYEDLIDAIWEYTKHGVGSSLTGYREKQRIVKAFQFSGKDTGVFIVRCSNSNAGRYITGSMMPIINIEYGIKYGPEFWAATDARLEIRRFIWIEDENGIVYGVDKLEKYFYYDYKEKEYRIKEELIAAHEEKLRQYWRSRRYGNYTFRRGSVPGIHKCWGKYGRRISYKHTLMAIEDDQCKEYGIKVRKRTAIDAWDIEPFEDYDRCWKQNKKCYRQWMKHSK